MNGRQRQRHTPRTIGIQVIMLTFDLGAVSTESTLNRLGPQSVNSIFSESCMFGEPSACLTRAETPSAPRLRAPPIATYFLAPFIV